VTNVEAGERQTNTVLLGWTQEYLRSLLVKDAGDSILALAWDEFYRIYDDLLRRFAAARGLKGQDVDDCLQAVWMEIAARLTDFERPEMRPGLRSWLYTLVRSESCDLLKRRARQKVESLDVARHVPAVASPDPLEAMERQWKQALLQTMLQEIRHEVSATNWRLLEMRFMLGSDVAQVAADLGLSSEEVRYRQRRLLNKLRRRAAALTGDLAAS
jgi:RNA polymerase sigma factor (sigma-70 family)